MALSAVLSLFWTRLLVDALGAGVYGIYLTFLSIAMLGGLGDFGLSGAIGIRTAQHLARGEDDTCRAFLATARGMILGLCVTFCLAFVVLSPWLPGWLHFAPVSGTGPLTPLFVVGGLGCAVAIAAGYFNNLNALYGNVVWPIIPGFLCLQLGSAAQWLLAVNGAPLWGQYLAQTGMATVSVGLVVAMLRVSHPWLGHVRPIRWNLPQVTGLLHTSFWAYLCAIGSTIYSTTDQILVNAGFGAAPVTAYRFNYKLCELAIIIVGTASYVALPAIVRRVLAVDEGERAHGFSGIERLQRLQTFMACGAAAAYLCVNDAFISLWVGPEFRMPLALQAAFAANLAITAAGEAGIQLRGRLDLGGIRLAGLTIGGTGLLNLLLSFMAMKAGWLVGIAAATVLAQSLLSLVLNYSTCRTLALPWGAWLVRSWLLPLGGVAAAFALRAWFPPDSLAHAIRLALLNVPLLVVLAWSLGLRPQMIAVEWQRLRSSFR